MVLKTYQFHLKKNKILFTIKVIVKMLFKVNN